MPDPNAINALNAISTVQRRALSLAGALIAGTLAACGSGSGAADALVDPQTLGLPAEKPDGSGFYLIDQHFGGVGDAVLIESQYWGRLVDVFSENQQTGVTELVYPDFVIGDSIQTEFGRWRLEVNPLTTRSRLIIERTNTDAVDDAFDLLVAEAESSVGDILEKGTGIGESPPFSLVARNAALVLQFSDLVDPTTVSLNDSFRVLVGNPPELPYEARLLFSPNHGGLASESGEFFSTRLIVDFTIDAAELAMLGSPLELNALGLPATIDPLQANLAIAIPTVEDPGAGNFDVMQNLRGRPFTVINNGPVNLNSPTRDVVRAMRSGFEEDPGNGFLSDDIPPSLVGSQAVLITSAVNDPSGQPGLDFITSISFATPECALAPEPGDAVRLGANTFEVTQQAAESQGNVVGLRLSLLSGSTPIDEPAEVLGQAVFRTPWRDSLAPSMAPCFVRFSPEPQSPPAAGVLPGSQIIVEFSEPMDPSSVRPFDTFVASSSEEITSIDQYVVANVVPSNDLGSFRLSPVVGFDHQEGSAEQFFLRLDSDSDDPIALTDLGGNLLTASLPTFPFALSQMASDNRSGGWALPFNEVDEYDAGVGNTNGTDLAGQVFYNQELGEIFPRPVTRFSAVADRSMPLMAAMNPVSTVFPGGLQTPLSNLGSKLHTMWRHADFGFNVSFSDGTFANLDIEGISLAPLNGLVTQTFYPLFEMVLGHSDRLPDEFIDFAVMPPLQVWPGSGLFSNASFAENFLSDPDNPPVVVHPRQNGYFVAQTDVFQAESGTVMLRTPMNRNVQPDEAITYTWRDTAITARGGFNLEGTEGAVGGLPFDQELVLATEPEEGPLYIASTAGVPSIGLPLLIEFSCFPSEAVSLNAFDASIPVTTGTLPFFRAFSTGGFNSSGNPVIKNPDGETSPSGGLNADPANGIALGTPTPGQDTIIYTGQIDVVVRVSRVYTTVIEADFNTPDYAGLIQEPLPLEQPSGTSIEFAFRGDNASGNPGNDYFDGADLDLYGNSISEASDSLDLSLSQPEWSSSLDDIDNLKWAQVRMSFFGNTETGLTPTLTSLAVAYRQ